MATLLAEGGRSVLILEREKFPRFRIGESLMPATFWTLQRLGLIDRLRCSHFPQKKSVQFFTRSGQATQPFFFAEFDSHESSSTWQVDRPEFDQLLVDNAVEKGAEVVFRANVRDVRFEGSRARGVSVIFDDDTRAEIGARVVVDATGQSAMLARRFKLRNADRNLLHVAFFTHFEGARRDEGDAAGGTLILHTSHQRSWFWFIPLPAGRVSIGVVGPLGHLVQGRDSDPQVVFDEELDACAALLERLQDATQLAPPRVLRDFSYAARSIAGEGWVLVGDAFGFLDPIYSSGVFLALKGGEFAADSILDAFARNDFSAAVLGQHGGEFVSGMEALRKMVYAFYSRNFHFAKFIEAHPEHREGVVDLLIGNVYRTDVSNLLRAMDDFCELPEYEPFCIQEKEAV